MEDFTSGHISTDEAAEIIRDIARELGGNGIEFFPGVSYRHLMVWRDGKEKMTTTPPHDITDQKIASHMPSGDGAEVLRKLMEASQPILPIIPSTRNACRRSPARHFHLALGQGRAPALPSLTERFGIRGGVISAVDIIHGLGVYAGLERIFVPGITGFLDTNYRGKGEYGVNSLEKMILSSSMSKPLMKPVTWAMLIRKFRPSRISTKKSSAPCSGECPIEKIGGFF